MAKIAIIADTHLGFGAGTEREVDCWGAATEALRKAAEADVILLAGDIFDSKVPKPEVWAKLGKILSQIQETKKNYKIEKITDKRKSYNLGIPIIAIHGTHERRGRGLINPVEALDWAGFLVHLHRSTALLKINNELVAVHGIGGVPERYALDEMQKWGPKPITGAYNILMFHQSVSPYIYNPIEPPSLNLDNLPAGFDMYIDGHVHWPVCAKSHGKTFLIPGSTIPTTVSSKESEIQKGFYITDTKTGSIKFIKLKSPRKVFYFKIDVSGKQDIRGEVEKCFAQVPEFRPKPLVGIKFVGKLEKGAEIETDFIKRFSDQAIISINKKIEQVELEANLRLLRQELKERQSIDELGMSILRKLAKDVRIKYDDVFDMLVDGEIDNAISILMRKGARMKREKEKIVEIEDEEGVKKIPVKNLRFWTRAVEQKLEEGDKHD